MSGGEQIFVFQCITLLFDFFYNRQALLLYTKGEKLMVELKDWKEGVEEHFEHDATGYYSIASN